MEGVGKRSAATGFHEGLKGGQELGVDDVDGRRKTRIGGLPTFASLHRLADALNDAAIALAVQGAQLRVLCQCLGRELGNFGEELIAYGTVEFGHGHDFGIFAQASGGQAGSEILELVLHFL